MAPATARKCQYPGCNFGEDGGAYTTVDGLPTHELVFKDLELHVKMAHDPQKNSQVIVKQESGHCDVKPDKFPRPEIADPATDSDWGYFVASWESYKRATNLIGQAVCDQLWHCPSSSLKKKVYELGIRPTDSEEAILAGIKRLTVKAHNNMVNIVQF